jgi:transcriptional regulator with XRE-family HTH domain
MEQEKTLQNISQHLLHPQENSDIVSYLRTELTLRCRKNPSYSLRSFASYLGVSSSFLSKLLNNKRPITKRTLIKFSERLGVSPEKYDQFTSKINSRSSQINVSFNNLSLDQFEVISEWYYFAILELITVKNFNPSPLWIANCLGISHMEAKEALQKLIRLNYIKVSKGKLLLTNKNNTTIGPVATAAAYQKQQKQILQKASEALVQTPFDLRSQTSVSLAISQKRLSEANNLIKTFRRQMIQLLQEQEKDSFDSVYQLSVSFYPLTKPLLKKEVRSIK